MNMTKYAPGMNITVNPLEGWNGLDGWTQVSIPGLSHIPHTTVNTGKKDRWIAVKDVAAYSRSPTSGVYETVIGKITPWTRWKNSKDFVVRGVSRGITIRIADLDIEEARKENADTEMQVLKTDPFYKDLATPCINPSLDRYWVTFIREKHPGGVRLHFVGDADLTYIFDYPEELPPTLAAKAAVVMNQAKVNGLLHTYNSHSFPYTRPTIEGFEGIGWPLDAEASVCVLIVTRKELIEWGADKHLLK